MVRPYILVVDDNRITTKLVLRYLQIHGYEAAEAADGVECLERVRERKPDAIILDVMMPRMDGFETARALKADSYSANIPIAIVTALNDMATQVRAVDAGADDFLTKPLEEKLLVTKVRILTDLSRARRQNEEYEKAINCFRGGDVALAEQILANEVFNIEVPPLPAAQ